MGYVPVGVLDPTVMVMVELPEPGAGIVLGLKLTVMPAGRPEADRLMSPLKPLVASIVMVETPCVPCTMLSRVGAAESAKFGCPCAVIVRVNVAVCLIPPPEALMVMGKVPNRARFSAVMVMVAMPAPGAGMVLGLKLTDTPKGTLEADRLTALLNPPLMAV